LHNQIFLKGTYSDFVTLFEQYGYITLFSSVFPWVTICALVNNIMEQRSDAFKYCHVNQRPFPNISSNGIGPWEVAFELLGIISVATNMALIALHPEVREYLKDYTDIEYFAFFVLLEVIKIIFLIADI
jgi:anoctamin-10